MTQKFALCFSLAVQSKVERVKYHKFTDMNGEHVEAQFAIDDKLAAPVIAPAFLIHELGGEDKLYEMMIRQSKTLLEVQGDVRTFREDRYGL